MNFSYGYKHFNKIISFGSIFSMLYLFKHSNFLLNQKICSISLCNGFVHVHIIASKFLKVLLQMFIE